MVQYDKSKSLPSENLLIKYTSKYACAPAALTAVAAQEGLLYNNKKTSTFKTLWSATATTVYKTKDYTLSDGTVIKNAKFGETLDNNINPGMKDYTNTYTSKTCTTSVKSNPTYNYFKARINENVSTIYTYTIQLTSGETSAHTINVVGYCSGTYSGSSANFIIVGDGWNSDSARYINFDKFSCYNDSARTFKFS